MAVWQEMASNQVPGISFTTNYCSKNESGKVVMLDFQMWKVREEDPDDPGMTREALRNMFFEKKMSNPMVMDDMSAMPHRVKLASLAQEGVRRLCNISQELGNKERCRVLSSFMQKLKVSGYKQATRVNILESAVRTFRHKERA